MCVVGGGLWSKYSVTDHNFISRIGTKYDVYRCLPQDRIWRKVFFIKGKGEFKHESWLLPSWTIMAIGSFCAMQARWPCWNLDLLSAMWVRHICQLIALCPLSGHKVIFSFTLLSFVQYKNESVRRTVRIELIFNCLPNHSITTNPGRTPSYQVDLTPFLHAINVFGKFLFRKWRIKAYLNLKDISLSLFSQGSDWVPNPLKQEI